MKHGRNCAAYTEPEPAAAAAQAQAGLPGWPGHRPAALPVPCHFRITGNAEPRTWSRGPVGSVLLWGCR